MIASLERTASIRGDNRIGELRLREGMIMATENRLQIQRLEAFEQCVRVQRPILYIRSHWKVREDDCRPIFVELADLGIDPIKRVLRDRSFLKLQALTGIQPDELPVAVRESVVEALRIRLFVGRPITTCSGIFNVFRISRTAPWCSGLP